MKKFEVSGTMAIGISITVEAADAEEAMSKAYEEFDGLIGYCGNGRNSGALVGTANPDVTISADCCEPEFADVAESETA